MRASDKIAVAAATVALLSAAVTAFLIAPGLLVASNRAATNAENISQSREAIEKSCILLSNAIIGSTSAEAQKPSKILIREILLNAESRGRPEVVLQYRRAVKSAGPLIQAPNCKRVAAHPEDVRLVATATPPPSSPLIPPQKR